MQYVGKLVSTVYNTITPNINPATLSGAIDVIVVERTVDIEEQVEVDLQGNILSDSERGEAFFVLEIDDDEERNNIPDDLVTSPILSAASSPISAAEDVGGNPENGGEPEVEPLELGEAEALPDDVPTNIDQDNPEDLDQNSKAKLKENKQSGQPDDQGDLNVPSDSTKTGSGSAAGSDSLLDKVGSAASKASGVIGAAGRVVMGGTNNPRLDKTAEKAQRGDDTNQMTGAPRRQQLKQSDADDADADDDDEDTAVDDDDEQEAKIARRNQAHRDKEEAEENDDIVGAVKVKQRKEDLQYMLDMDGYKMTPDGEDLAYQEA
ncbi:hypothetical protein NDA16_003451 [Ustilago loliicola]|nr:hypothetical protein NDA16_003451 [Ustilago loliicola]